VTTTLLLDDCYLRLLMMLYIKLIDQASKQAMHTVTQNAMRFFPEHNHILYNWRIE